MSHRPGITAAALSLLVALAASCTLTRPLHDLTCEPGAANASCLLGQSCESDRDCSSAICSSNLCVCPEDMETVDSRLCVDRFEVTNAQYQRFLDTKPDPLLQDAACRWNIDFGFDQGLVVKDNYCSTRQSGGDYPASCVDWCDAHAFCASRGKHLCGKFHGGQNPTTESADVTGSEWFYACSEGGQLEFPTGSYDPVKCNVDLASGSRAVGNTSTNPCGGKSLSIYDMSGNVGEWEDSCTGATGVDDSCLVRGGSFDLGGMTPADYQCSAAVKYKRDETYYSIGFRCCGG